MLLCHQCFRCRLIFQSNMQLGGTADLAGQELSGQGRTCPVCNALHTPVHSLLRCSERSLC